MKLTGEITKQETNGDELTVTVSNIVRKTQAHYRPYGPSLCMNVPLSKAPEYRVGRKVTLSVQFP